MSWSRASPGHFHKWNFTKFNWGNNEVLSLYLVKKKYGYKFQEMANILWCYICSSMQILNLGLHQHHRSVCCRCSDILLRDGGNNQRRNLRLIFFSVSLWAVPFQNLGEHGSQESSYFLLCSKSFIIWRLFNYTIAQFCHLLSSMCSVDVTFTVFSFLIIYPQQFWT